jgi:Holliday junction resolvase RusA-like endonuclease
MTVEFFVPGIPRPQGSKSVSRTGHLYESSKGLRAWRKTVAMTAIAWKAKQSAKVRKLLPLDGALLARFEFYLSRPRRTKHARYPLGPPDLAKLVRAVEDSLKEGGLIVDDSRIYDEAAIKFWATEGKPGCQILLRVMRDLPATSCGSA